MENSITKNVTEELVESPAGTFPANVIDVSTPNQLVINRGKNNGIQLGQRMLVYCIGSKELKDPQTGKSLGYLEIVRGTGRVVHVQNEISTIESDREKHYTREFKTPYSDYFSGLPREVIHESTIIPFDNPLVGDLVKPI